MTTASRAGRLRPGEEYLPKIVTVLREGYGRASLRADALAGLTVAIVALPLSMAIAIASGVGPERGLYTAIVGGFLVSALGGSRHQIGGPAGAFIVLIAACVADIGVSGLVLATFLSGFLLMAIGVLRLGGYIKFIPYPVVVGFTAGIAVIILSSQVKELFGLTLPGPEPAALLPKLAALWDARGSVSGAAVAIAFGTIAMIEGIKRLRPGWPSLLIAVAVASIATAGLGLDVETIGTRFGELPRLPPAPALPTLSGAALAEAIPYAVSFALLGAIESLLSAIVADGMTGAQHRSNAELVAQGVANAGSALFGGICVTGTIARTATNVRAGSRGPISGMLHALFVLAFMVVAAPLAGNIPLAALAGLLAVVAWGMAEKEEFWALLRASKGDAMVLLATFLLVIFRDLTEGIVVGFALGGLVFIRRMSEAARLEPAGEAVEELSEATDPDVLVYHIRGAFFFGAAATVGSVLDRIAGRPRNFVVDLSEVPLMDSTGARSLGLLAQKMARKGGRLYLTAASPDVRRMLWAQGVREPKVRFLPDVAGALAEARGKATNQG
ncbi:SulP family inorganic anion transporter [Ostreiculturibacter nitratireducens]|uniref:SulP family inorganic anion transporter n=1 Tax=Ostreiculturibacter nitratireducens TaxID=3075226 RepID=UPI0031B62144